MKTLTQEHSDLEKRIRYSIKAGLLDFILEEKRALIDRIEQSLNSHTTPEGKDLLTRSYIRNALNFERATLNPKERDGDGN